MRCKRVGIRWNQNPNKINKMHKISTTKNLKYLIKCLLSAIINKNWVIHIWIFTQMWHLLLRQPSFSVSMTKQWVNSKKLSNAKRKTTLMPVLSSQAWWSIQTRRMNLLDISLLHKAHKITQSKVSGKWWSKTKSQKSWPYVK